MPRLRSGLRLTARGCGALTAGPVLLISGVIWHYPEIAIVGAVALGGVLIAAALIAGVPKIGVRREIDPDRVVRGEPCRVRLRLMRRRRGSIASDLVAVDRCGTNLIEAPLARLRRERETTVGYDVPTNRRGIVPIGPLQIRRADPFGLLTAQSDHGDADRVFVYPKVYPMGGVPRGVTRSLDGLDDNVASGAITFDRLRPYVRGDEMRHVHWRTSARLGELMVREHVEESVPTVVVLLDDRTAAYADPDDFEEACDAAASLADAAARADLSPILLMTVDRGAGPIMDRLAKVMLAESEVAAAHAGIADLVRLAGGDTIVLLTGDGPYAAEAAAAISALGGPRTSVVIAEFAAGADETGTTAEESALDRVLRLRVRDAGAFATAWQRRHSARARPTGAPGAVASTDGAAA